GRSIEVDLVPLSGLGEWEERIAGAASRSLIRETPLGGGTGVLPADVAAERDAARLEGLGRGLVAGLLRACLDHGVEITTQARGVRLLTQGNAGTGVEIETPDGPREARASAVVLATGGFEYDPDLVRDFLRGPVTWRLGAPTNTGDGLRMAMRVGARLGN